MRNWRLLSPYQFVLFAMSSSTGFHFRCSACTKVMASAGDIARRPVLQEFDCQMREPADAGDSTRYFVWMPFRSGNEIGKFFDAERGIDDNEHGIFGREPDRGKVTRQLDWQIGRGSWQRREGGQDRHIKRVSTEVQMRPTRSYSGQHVVEGVVHRGLLFRVERAT